MINAIEVTREMTRENGFLTERILFERGGDLVAFAVREEEHPYFWLLKVPGRDGHLDRDRYSNDLIERVELGHYDELSENEVEDS